ncbi:hypothetical protein [Homoserinimonas hongtaonis]|uniref:hypothetical protein n=1 Tax=Homoserinimonas hongtaonis TaxID=2079791 RepID=UPI000D379A3C|nr:hypothetical protein [Salinibacterium hongtaonis]AWB89673.1 hypothetical protein C2138_09065 [Salinibacterium hongtaonis]
MNNDVDALFNDLGTPEPEAAKPAAPPRPPRTPRRALPWVIVGVVVLLLAGGGVAFALLGQGDSDAAAPAPSPSASASPSVSAEPSPEPEQPAPAAAAMPAACVELFSPGYHAELSSTGAVLSAGNTGPRERPFDENEVPAAVESTIASAPHLECAWGFSDNYNVGIHTVVAKVTDEQAVQITQALAGAGFASTPELGSVRYIKQIAGEEGFGPHGYSIIARDGLLIATEWLDWPASGYTADIVNTVLGPAGA